MGKLVVKAQCTLLKTTASRVSRQLKEVQNKTNSKNRHLVRMRGLMKRYKNKDNCLLALSPQFNSGILRFTNMRF